MRQLAGGLHHCGHSSEPLDEATRDASAVASTRRSLGFRRRRRVVSALGLCSTSGCFLFQDGLLLGVHKVIVAGAGKLLPLVALLLSVDRRLIDLPLVENMPNIQGEFEF
jgi:hypothetical protein